MRAVNLIPPEERSGRVQMRAGSLSYVILGVLIALLLGVTAVVLTNNQISDSKAQIASLEQQKEAAEARAESLSAFAEFRNLQEQRTTTVTTLAQSRFDWERVMHELALILPSDVWLVQLEATVSPDVQVTEGVEIGVRDSVAGPAIEIVGCTVSQDAVGAFVAALRDIDGVTRVTVASSERPELSESETEQQAQSGGSTASDECRTRDFITKFEVVAAFDAVPVPASAPEPAAAPPTGETAPPPSEAAPETGEAPPADGSVEEGIQEGQEAADIPPGT